MKIILNDCRNFINIINLKDKMRKIFILGLMLLSLLFLTGCAPEYECRVSVGSDCNANTAGSGKHYCQIYNPFYSPGNDVPSYCMEDCVKRSGVLDQSDDACIIVELAYSSKNTSSMGSTAVIMTSYYEITYEDVVENETKEDDNKDEEFKGIKECELPSDCITLCRGSVIVKQTCNLNNYKCEDTFTKEDCSQVTTNFMETDYVNICKEGECIINVEDLKADRTALRDEYNNITVIRQELQSKALTYDDYCIKGLASAMTLLLSDALKYGQLGKSALGFMAMSGKIFYNEGMKKIENNDNSLDLTAWYCRMKEICYEEIDKVEITKQEVKNDIEVYDTKIAEFE